MLGEMMNVSIIIPVYNEQEGIAVVLKELRNLDLGGQFEIIVVDDSSTDRTAEILKDFSNEVQVIRHEKNMGYGAAIKTGIRHAKSDLVVITDADGTYPNQEIRRLVEEMKEHDMVVGARTGEGAQIPMIRKPAKWFITKLASYLTGRQIPDLNSGLRVMKKEIVEKYLHILPDEFSFTSTITLAMLTNGYSVKYVPIGYFKRKGKSKIKPIRDTLNFIQLIEQSCILTH